MTLVRQVVVDGVKISGRAWFKYASVAEKRGLTVAQLIAAMSEAAVSDPPPLAEGEKFGRPSTPVERRKMTPRRLTRCRELYVLGCTDRDIATQVGLDIQSIEAWRGREELPARPRLVGDHPTKGEARMSAPELSATEAAIVKAFGLDTPETDESEARPV